MEDFIPQDSIYPGLGKDDLLDQANNMKDTTEKYRILAELQKAPYGNFDVDTFTTENNIKPSTFKPKGIHALDVGHTGTIVGSNSAIARSLRQVDFTNPAIEAFEKKSGIGKKGLPIERIGQTFDLLKKDTSVKNSSIIETRMQEILEEVARENGGKIYKEDLTALKDHLDGNRFFVSDNSGKFYGYPAVWPPASNSKNRFEYVFNSPEVETYGRGENNHYDGGTYISKAKPPFGYDERLEGPYVWHMRGYENRENGLVVTEIQSDALNKQAGILSSGRVQLQKVMETEGPEAAKYYSSSNKGYSYLRDKKEARLKEASIVNAKSIEEEYNRYLPENAAYDNFNLEDAVKILEDVNTAEHLDLFDWAFKNKDTTVLDKALSKVFKNEPVKKINLIKNILDLIGDLQADQQSNYTIEEYRDFIAFFRKAVTKDGYGDKEEFLNPQEGTVFRSIRLFSLSDADRKSVISELLKKDVTNVTKHDLAGYLDEKTLKETVDNGLVTTKDFNPYYYIAHSKESRSYIADSLLDNFTTSGYTSEKNFPLQFLAENASDQKFSKFLNEADIKVRDLLKHAEFKNMSVPKLRAIIKKFQPWDKTAALQYTIPNLLDQMTPSKLKTAVEDIQTRDVSPGFANFASPKFLTAYSEVMFEQRKRSMLVALVDAAGGSRAEDSVTNWLLDNAKKFKPAANRDHDPFIKTFKDFIKTFGSKLIKNPARWAKLKLKYTKALKDADYVKQMQHGDPFISRALGDDKAHLKAFNDSKDYAGDSLVWGPFFSISSEAVHDKILSSPLEIAPIILAKLLKNTGAKQHEKFRKDFYQTYLEDWGGNDNLRLVEEALEEGFYETRKALGQDVRLPGGLDEVAKTASDSFMRAPKDNSRIKSSVDKVKAERESKILEKPINLDIYKNAFAQAADRAMRQGNKTFEFVIEPQVAYGVDLQRGMGEGETLVQKNYLRGKKTLEKMANSKGLQHKYVKGILVVTTPASLSLSAYAQEPIQKAETPYNQDNLDEVKQMLDTGQGTLEEAREFLTDKYDKDIASNFLLDMMSDDIDAARANGDSDDDIAKDLQKAGILPKVPYRHPGIFLKHLSSQKAIDQPPKQPDTSNFFGDETGIIKNFDPEEWNEFHPDYLDTVTPKVVSEFTEEELSRKLSALYAQRKDDKNNPNPAIATMLYNLGKGYILNDPEAKRRAATLIDYQSNLVAEAMRRKGLDVRFEDSMLYITRDGVTEPLTSDLFESIRDGIWDAKREILGSIGLGLAAGLRTPGPWPVKVASGIVGSALGAGVGRMSDYVSLALQTNEQISASQLVTEFKDAAQLDAIFAVLGTTALQFIKGTYKGSAFTLRKIRDLASSDSAEAVKLAIKSLNLPVPKANELVSTLAKSTALRAQAIVGQVTGFDRLARGNPRGAFKSLKLVLNKSDEDLIKAVEEFEELNGRKLLTYNARKSRKVRNVKDIRTVLRVMQETMPGFEKRISSAMPKAKGEGAVLSDKIAKRSENLLELIGEGSTQNTMHNLRAGLKAYVANVKDSRTALKKKANKILIDNARIGLTDLDLVNFLQKTKLHKQNPRILEEIDDHIAFIKSDIKNSTNSQHQFQALLQFRKIITRLQAKQDGTDEVATHALGKKLIEVDKKIHKVSKESMGEEGAGWWKSFNISNKEYHKLFKVQEDAVFKALSHKNPKSAKALVKNILDGATSIDREQLMRVLGKLKKPLRGELENEIVLHVVAKNSVDFNDGTIIDFRGLAQSLDEVALTQQRAKNIKQVINQMAKLYRNDPHMARSLGRNPSESGARFFATSPLSAAKQHMLSVGLNWFLASIPGRAAKKRALMIQLSKVMDNPLDSRSAKELFKIVNNNPEVTSAFHNMSESFAQYGRREDYSKQRIYRTSGASKNSQGEIYHTNKSTLSEINKSYNVSVRKKDKLRIESKEIAPTLIAKPEDAALLLGRPVEATDLSNKVLIKNLKEKGFNGLAIDTRVLIFK